MLRKGGGGFVWPNHPSTERWYLVNIFAPNFSLFNFAKGLPQFIFFFFSFFQFCYYCVYVIMKMKRSVSFVAKGVKLALAKWMLNKKNVMLFWWERWQVLLTVKKLLMDLSFCKMCHFMLLRSFRRITVLHAHL